MICLFSFSCFGLLVSLCSYKFIIGCFIFKIFRGLLEPIVTPKVLQQQPHPITSLYQECQNQEPWRDGQENIASIHVNGVFVASGSSNQIMDIAELKATKQALLELSKSMPTNIRRSDFSFELNKSFEIKLAKKKLHEVCQKKRWAGPSYIYI